jgi:hypothetical protein
MVVEDTPPDYGDRFIDRNLRVSSAHIVNSAEIFSNRLTSRTKRVAARSIAAIPTVSIALIGVAVLIADPGYELYAACEAVSNLD